MKIFTKMKHMMLMATVVLCTSAAFAQEYGVVWNNTFEEAVTLTDGWTIGGNTTASQVTLSNGSKAIQITTNAGGNRESSYSFTNENFANAEDYKLEFDWGLSSAGDRETTVSLIADNAEGQLFVLKNPAYTASSTIYAADGATELGTITNDTRTIKTPTIISTFLIEGSSKGVTLTITQNGETVLDAIQLSAELTHVKGIKISMGRTYAYMVFDDFALYLPGASEGISAPSCSITNTYNEARTITITHGLGTEGTLAEGTYYTINGDEPTKESEKYTGPFTVSESCVVKAVSYLPSGTASEICEFAVEAGYAWPLNADVVKIIGLAGESDTKNPVFDNCYNNDGVLGNPEVTFSYTFNGEDVEIPYTVTEDGVLIATAEAEGYESASEMLDVKANYMAVKSVDFTTITDENLVEVLGDTWSITATNTRWSGWDKSKGDIYSIATCSDPGHLTEFLGSTCGTMIVGYGVARNHNSATKYWINDGEEGQIALYEVNEAKKATTDFVEYAVAYADDNEMAHSVYNVNAIAKVSVYSPVRELTVTEGADLTATGTFTSAAYTRTIAEGAYGTICLPFAPDAASLENYTFFKMESAGADAINFVEETAPQANTPYIYCLKGENVAITGGATVVSADINSVEVGNWTMKGSFTKQTIATAGADTKYYGYVADQNKIVKANKTLTVLPYRAYFTAPVNATAVALRITRGDETTEITAADLDVQPAAVIYDFAGRRVEKMEKGIYIVNGKKVIR